MIKYFLPPEYPDLVRATEGSSGYDVRALLGAERELEPGRRWKIPTGLHLEMPIGIEAQVRSRSGLSMNHGIVVLGAPCTIDADYRGEVFVMLINHGHEPYRVKPGDRIAQLVFAPVMVHYDELMLQPFEHEFRVDRVSDRSTLSITSRDTGGFGSTGR